MHYFRRDTWTRKKTSQGLLIEAMIILKRILKYISCDDLNAICHVEDRRKH
jgi:hypothetical protein